MTSALKRFQWACWERLAKVLARAYIVGPGLEDALAAARRLKAEGTASILCHWDMPGEPAEAIAAAHLAALEALKGSGLDSHLSIKSPALRFDLALHARLAGAARSAGIRLHFDSHSHEEADATFSVMSEALKLSPNIGATLPGRWRRSLADADWVVARKLPVRVVKGQWPDPSAPEADLNAGYLEVIDRLCGRAVHVGVATHDPALALEALRRLRAQDTPCELELLYGLPSKAAREEARRAGVGVRVYLPYGHGWLPYGLSQVKQRPKILWWMLKDLLGGKSE